jgi:hypothetical protein
MHRLLTALIVTVLPLSAVNAQQAAPARVEVSGTVEAVDANAMKLSVTDARGTTREYAVAQDAAIRKNGRAVNLSEVAAGDSVTVTCGGPANRREVRTIIVHAKQPAP